MTQKITTSIAKPGPYRSSARPLVASQEAAVTLRVSQIGPGHASAKQLLRVRPRPSCPLCGHAGAMLYEDLHDRLFSTEGSWNMSRCLACGLLWLDPAPVEEDIHLAYGTYYTHSRSEPHGIRG